MTLELLLGIVIGTTLQYFQPKLFPTVRDWIVLVAKTIYNKFTKKKHGTNNS